MTAQTEVLLDSDTLSLFLKQSPRVFAKAVDYLSAHSGLTFSIVTRFEVLRGLKAKNAQAQIAKFEIVCANSVIYNLSDSIVVRAADVYADLHQRGRLIGDADTSIAATALEYNLAVVTNNENHYNRVGGLQVLNWNK